VAVALFDVCPAPVGDLTVRPVRRSPGACCTAPCVPVRARADPCVLYGAVALVLASIITPLVCLALGAARTRLARCVERRRARRRRFDKSGEYERVDRTTDWID